MDNKLKPITLEGKELEKQVLYNIVCPLSQDTVKVNILDFKPMDEIAGGEALLEICLFTQDIDLKTIMIPIKKNKILSIYTYLQSEFIEIAKKLGDMNRENISKTTDGNIPVDIDISQMKKDLNKLKLKLSFASNFIASKGRIGPANFLISSEINNLMTLDNIPSFLNHVVDKDMTDDVIIIGRRSDASNPGVLLLLNENSLSNIVYNEQNEECVNLTYAFALLGFHPEKQFITINIKK
jgi:hypothetical protein